MGVVENLLLAKYVVDFEVCLDSPAYPTSMVSVFRG